MTRAWSALGAARTALPKLPGHMGRSWELDPTELQCEPGVLTLRVRRPPPHHTRLLPPPLRATRSPFACPCRPPHPCSTAWVPSWIPAISQAPSVTMELLIAKDADSGRGARSRRQIREHVIHTRWFQRIILLVRLTPLLRRR